MAESLPKSERDMTPVAITLDRKRPYHIGDDERNVVWVGPGAVEVPRWVAEHWGAVEVVSAPKVPEVQLASAPKVPEPLPEGAVTATIETVEEQPTQTIETVLEGTLPAAPAAPKRRR